MYKFIFDGILTVFLWWLLTDCPKNCRYDCPGDKEFQECGSACPTTCDNKDIFVACVTDCRRGKTKIRN